MKLKKNLKLLLVALVFTVSYLGVTVVNKTQKVANERISVSLLTVGNQAQAYCNEARYKNESNNGKCSGTASFPESRCTASASGTACIIE
ncbi:hypothetical protein [Mucilaginibacter dorajii]|uniref:NVEALA family protein n=1 Tax=Mucilaginibacter dorajii TaxID=692994 RepID=A0ABP7QZ99_9SPHI|nr:hypothetical protein [Mucilaginibacter dorajii]MCS3732315.1 hypothetical protein [Mucilaginibacter dorajii]